MPYVRTLKKCSECGKMFRRGHDGSRAGKVPLCKECVWEEFNLNVGFDMMRKENGKAFKI